jgi:hypothetical protein
MIRAEEAENRQTASRLHAVFDELRKKPQSVEILRSPITASPQTVRVVRQPHHNMSRVLCQR